jgi:predicted dehydrogenase
MSIERLGVALIGSGRIGAVHLRNILASPRLDLRYVVDVDAKSAAGDNFTECERLTP